MELGKSREKRNLLAEGELAIPFAQADKLALKLGFADEHPQRLEAGVAFTLQHNLDNGHTFLPRQKLLQAASALLGVPDLEALEDALYQVFHDEDAYAAREREIDEAANVLWDIDRVISTAYDFFEEGDKYVEGAQKGSRSAFTGSVEPRGGDYIFYNG